MAGLPGPRAPDPNALGLENQKAPSQVLLFKSGDPSEEEPDLLAGRRSVGESRDKNPVMGSEGQAEDVCKAFIARDQGVTMRACVPEDQIICRRAKTQIANIIGRIPLPAQSDKRGTRQVGVNEESDHRLATLISSSATTSAAYRRTARTSSRVTPYSRAMLTKGVPAAISSRIAATGTRVPLITGWPNRTRGSTVMRGAISTALVLLTGTLDPLQPKNAILLECTFGCWET